MSSKTPQSNFSTLSRGNNNNKRVYPDQDSLLTTKNPHLLHLSPQPPNLLSAANLLSTGELFAGTTSKNFVLSTADLSRALNNTGADAVATNLPNRLPKTRTSQGNNNQGSSAHRTQTTGTRPSTGLVGRASLIGQMVTSPNQLPRVGAAGGNSSGIASPGGMASPMNDSNNNLAIHIPAIIPPSSSSIANRPAQWTKSNSKHVGKSANAASASAAVATGEGGLGGASGSSGSQRLHETPPASGQTPSYSVGMPPSSSSMSASGAKIFQDDEISIGSKKLSRRHPSKTSSLRAGASQHVFSDEDLRNNTNMNSGGGGGVSSRYVFGDQSQSSFGMNGVGSSGFIPPALLPFSSHSLPLNNSAAAPINSAALVNSLLKAGLASKNGGEGGGENGSVYSRTLQDRLHQYGNALRGPIIVEMFLHYSYFLIVLLAAFITNWAPQIHFYMGFFYYVVSILTLTLSRLIFTRKVNSVLPFYISLPAFGILIFVSREAHMIVMVLWFLSILIIFVQTGNKSLHKHLCFFVALFVATYILAIWVMNITYKTDCSGVTCGAPLSTPINPKNEAVFISACVMVVMIFMFLERFIRMNAVTLVERENYMRQLYYINVDLKKQLRRDKNLKEIDLEAPLTRATQILKGIKDSGDLDASVTQELEIIISLLSSDQLFSPDIFQKPADSDVHDWLNDMLLPNIKKREPATISRKPAGETIKEEQQDLEEMGEHKLEDEPISIVDDLQQRLHLEFRKSEAAKKIEKSLESKIKDRRFFEMLSGFTDNPGFNVYTVDVESGGNSLYYVGWSVFKKHNLFSRFRISETKFLNWLTYIQAGYIRENPYHNHIHAADVTHSMQYYVTRNRIWDTLTPEEQLATVIAPIIHDYAHPGVNNAYLISTVDMLAIRYSDLAILEHFHCATIFEMMREDQYNIFENLSLEERKSIREMIISMVLATDMAHHFEWIGKFKTKMSGNGLNLDQKADRKLLLNMAIKCADVNNPSKPTDQSKMWTDLIMEEFFRQGEKEKAKGLPVSMFMNRDTTDVPKCQIGFIDFIVSPLFEAWKLFMLEDVQPHIDNIQQNKQYWKQAAERAAAAALIAANSANMERVSSQFALRTDGSSLLAAAGGSGGDGSGLATAGNNTNNQNSSSNIPAITPPPLTSQPTIMTDAIRKTFSKAAASKDSLPENNSDNNIVQIPTIRQTNSKTDIFTSKLSSAASNSHNGSNSRLVANRILADATGPKPRHMGSTGRDSIGLSQNNSTSSLAGGGGGAGVSLLGYNTSTGFLETTYSATIPHDRSHTKNVSSLSKLGDIIGSDQTRPLHSASISNRSLQIENSQGGLRLTSGNVVVGVGASSQSSAAGGQPDAISQNILLSTHMTSTLTGSVISTVSPLEQHHPVFRQNSSTSRSITITAASVAGRDAEGGGGSSSVPSVQNGSIPLMSVNSDSIHSAMSVAGEHDGAPSHLNLAPRGGN